MIAFGNIFIGAYGYQQPYQQPVIIQQHHKKKGGGILGSNTGKMAAGKNTNRIIYWEEWITKIWSGVP